MEPIEWFVFAVAAVVIVVAAVVIDKQINPPPPPPPPLPPPPPPPPPPIVNVSVTANPGRFSLQLINAPSNIVGRGQFRIQIIAAGAWTALEVPDLSNAAVEVEVVDGDGQGLVSFIREFQLNSSGQLGASDTTFISRPTNSAGSMHVTVVSGGTPGADRLTANIVGSPNPPVTADYEIVPPP